VTNLAALWHKLKEQQIKIKNKKPTVPRKNLINKITRIFINILLLCQDTIQHGSG
jgi:hypothetical protein